MKFGAWYAIIVGTIMIGQWIVFISTGQVPELQSEPIRIAFHLTAEGVTAVGLIASGITLLGRGRFAVSMHRIFSGMLLYSVIVSPGYFAQMGQWEFVAMFAILCILTILSSISVGRPLQTTST